MSQTCAKLTLLGAVWRKNFARRVSRKTDYRNVHLSEVYICEQQMLENSGDHFKLQHFSYIFADPQLFTL